MKSQKENITLSLKNIGLSLSPMFLMLSICLMTFRGRKMSNTSKLQCKEKLSNEIYLTINNNIDPYQSRRFIYIP